MNPIPAPTWLEIDTQAVTRNTRTVLAMTHTPLMAVVKADAYGFGAVPVAQAALAGGAEWLAVARGSEALALRQAGIRAPILVFGMVTPDEMTAAVEQEITLNLFNFEMIAALSAQARACGKPARVHLKVDTGMGRLGVMAEDAGALAQAAQQSGGIEIDGIFSHFAMVDSEADDPLTPLQMQRFAQAIQAVRTAGLQPRWIHCSNSAAAFSRPDAYYTLLRVGSALLGIRPFYYQPFPSYLQRVLTWKAVLADCRQVPAGWGISYGHDYITTAPEWIGVLPLGYGDGFRRAPNNQVILNGEIVPVVGRVCTDMCMLRLPRQTAPGSEVILIGQQGGQTIQIEDLANRWQTSQAAVTCGIAPRVPRIYPD